MVPFEFYMLGLSVALGFVPIIAASHSASLQRGYRWTASARGASVTPLAGVAARLARALGNFCETFPLFAALAIVVVVPNDLAARRRPSPGKTMRWVWLT